MYGLAAAIIGAGLATVGVFLFFSNRRAGRARRGLLSELVAVCLLLGGGALLLSSVTIAPQDPFDAVATLDPNRLLEQHPPASGGEPAGATRAPQWPYRRIAVITWGTPSDNDAASEVRIERYSRKLQQLAMAQLHELANEAKFIPRNLHREEYRLLRESTLGAQAWCDKLEADLVLAIGVGSTRVNGEYALWREPLYELLDCQTGKTTRQLGRINERAGDAFPYQLGLSDELAGLLREFSAER